MAQKILFEITAEDIGVSRRIAELQALIRQLNKEIKAGDKTGEAYDELLANLTKAKRETELLREEQRKLNREFKAQQVPRDSLAGLRIEYARLTEQITKFSKAERETDNGKRLIANAAALKTQINGIEESVGRFTGSVGNYRKALLSVGDLVTGGLITGGIVGAVELSIAIFQRGVAAVADYGAALDRLSAITGVTGDQLKQFEQTAKGLTTIEIGDGQIVNTGANILEAFTLVGSARPELLKSADALAAVTREAIILSKASGDDLVTSVEAVTTTLGQFQLPAKDAARVTNELAAGAKAGASEIVDTTIALKKFGTTAAVANVSTGEAITLVETLADRQLKGEEAGTQLRNILAKLAGADILPRNALRQLDQAGVNINVLKDTTLPLIDRLTELGKLQGNTAALTKVFGLENLNAAQIITSGLPKYQQLLSQIEGTNEAYIQAGINSSNLKTELQNLQAKGVNTLVAVFQTLEPTITAFVKAISEPGKFLEQFSAELTAVGAALIFVRVQSIAAAGGFSLFGIALRAQSAASAVAAAGTRLLGLAMNALPVIAIAAAVYGLVKAFQAYQDSADASEKATRAVADAQADIAKESAKEAEAVRQNINVLKADGVSKEARKKAIDALVSAYPDYLRGMDLEKASVSDLAALQDRLTDSIIRSAAERKKQQALEAVQEKIIGEQLDQDRIRTKGLTRLEKLQNAPGIQAGGFFVPTGLDTQEAAIIRSQRKLEGYKKELEATEQQFDRAFNIGKSELVVVEPTRGKAAEDAKKAAAKAKAAADAKTGTGGGGGKGRGKGGAALTKEEADLAAGSLAALQKEVQTLQKQVENEPGDSKVFEPLVQQLNEAEARLKALQDRLEALKSPKIEIDVQSDAVVEAAQRELTPQGSTGTPADTSLTEAQLAAAVENNAARVDDEEFTAEQIAAFNQDLLDKKIGLNEEELAEAKANAEERKKLEQEVRDAALASANTIAGAVIAIQSNRAKQEEERAIAALESEYQKKTAAAQGNATKLEALEKEQAVKRQKIEKDGAKKRKQIAIKEAIIQGALAVVKALPNLILAGVAALGTVAQIAIINSQEFAEGGVVRPERKGKPSAKAVGRPTPTRYPRMQPGVIRQRSNAPRTAKGDSILAYLAPREMVLNEGQQRTVMQLSGRDIFYRAGVPGASGAAGYGGEGGKGGQAGQPGRSAISHHFATGGIAGIMPQAGLRQSVQAAQASTVTVVRAEAAFSDEQMAQIGAIIGTEVARRTGDEVRTGLALGLNDNNRQLERQAALEQNRLI